MSYERRKLDSVYFPSFLKSLPKSNGKVVVITGTTSGTGYIAARTAAQLGATVYVLNRPSERSAKALEAIQKEVEGSTITQVDCDLQSFDSVKSAIAILKEKCSNGIDVLCNNAGVMALKDEATVDGYDVQMQTNHISHFLLTAELYPLLKKAADSNGDARIVNHSSIARLAVKKLEGKYLEKNGGNLGGNGASMFFNGARWVRYGQTKLANAAFTASLHQKLSDASSKVKALVAHPGLAATDLQVTSVKDGGMGAAATNFMMGFGQSMEDGAMGILACMFLPGAQSGEFYGPGKGMFAMKGEAKPFALEKKYNNDKTIDLIWEKSCEATGVKQDFIN